MAHNLYSFQSRLSGTRIPANMLPHTVQFMGSEDVPHLANGHGPGKQSNSCCNGDPNDTTGPLRSMDGPKEDIIYVLCLQSPKSVQEGKCGYMATVSSNPKSPDYGKVIHRLYTLDPRDELHHFGWNSCVSCKNPKIKRKYLIIPGFSTGNLYIVDVGTDPCNPRIFRTILGAGIRNRFDITYPHTVHCIPSGEVMISYLGDGEYNAKGAFLLLNGVTFEPVGLWNDPPEPGIMGYDFWYQPRHNIMVSTEFGAPKAFMTGFHITDFQKGLYGTKLHFFDWTSHKLINSLDLGADGAIPLEIRFLHNPAASEGFVGCALSSTVYNIHKTDDGKWNAVKVISVPPKTVSNWTFEQMPGLVTDILLSMDDRYLYFSNFVHGDVRQYDISDPRNPKFVSSVFLGGSVCKGESVTVLHDSDLHDQPERPKIKGKTIPGAPNMLQLSRDGKRLYVTMSLVTPWDAQFYPEIVEKGSGIILLDCSEKGMKINQDFFADLASEPDGAIRGHEVRYPGGDCTSDIWV